MSKGSGSKPTPPPLDDGEKVAAAGDSSLPHAESGKATAEDAHRATVDAARAADPRAAAAAAAAVNERARDTPSPDDEVPPPAAGDEPPEPVLFADSGGQFIARPNPQVPLDPKADLVLGNWFGHVRRGDELVQVHVKHCTLFGALPSEVRAAIRKTKGVQVGPLPPKLPQNPFQP